MARTFAGSINHLGGVLLAVALAAASLPAQGAGGAGADPEGAARALFEEAWEAARTGDRARFDALGPRLEGYSLWPYWQYEDYRHRRSQVPVTEMKAFLDAHRDWAFTSALESAWLRSLGRSGRWQALRDHGGEARSAELKCLHARARLELGELDGLLADAQSLWTVGRSQHEACDPLFDWMMAEHGVTPELAWERVRLAMSAGNPRLTLYLARFLPPQDRAWLERWQRLERDRYRQLEKAAGWPVNDLTRSITAVSLERLAHRDSAAAMQAFGHLDRHYDWDTNLRRAVMHEIGLMAAVDLEPAALDFIARMPAAHVDDQLAQWWARAALAQEDWSGALQAMERLSADSRNDARWRYWNARARIETGDDAAGREALEALATETHYYAFLAADALERPYTICPLEPQVEPAAVAALATRADFARALELRRVGLDSWAAAEWEMAARRLEPDQLRLAAALAVEEQWPERAIFALGNSGELRFYEWRFPLLWEEAVMRASGDTGVDPAWVYGVMRSESAMTENARSSAGALGLMQVLPGTARSLAKKHGLRYGGQDQLLQGESNIQFGTLYLRDLLDEFAGNPVLVSGAYNAGPNAVERWLGPRATPPMRRDTALWVETLPYYETRDYIPRVLAFTTLYDWRLRNPVRRVSSRMPAIELAEMPPAATTEVVCRLPDAVLARQDVASP